MEIRPGQGPREEDDGHPAVAGVSEQLTVMTEVIRTKEEEGTAFFS